MSSCTLDADNVFGPVVVGCRDSFDLTLLFEQAILSLLPAVFAVVVAVASIFRLWKQGVKIKSDKIGRPRVTISVIAFLCFAAVHLALVVLWTLPSNAPTKISVPSSVLGIVLGITFAVLSIIHHSRSVRPSGLLALYLIFSVLLDVAQARTLWLRRGNTTVAAVFTLTVALKVLVLPVVMLEKRLMLKTPYSEYPPEALGGMVNRGFFWWINALLVKGSSTRLEVECLFDIDRKLTVEFLLPRFRPSWAVVKGKIAHALLLAVLRNFWVNILFIAGFRFALIAFKFCQPLLINRAISLLLEPDSQSKTNSGRALIGATSLTYIGIALTTGMFRHNVYRLITMVRGSLIGMIYDKTLVLDALKAGDSAALTLMSTDVERVANGFEVFDALWAAPVEVVIAMVLLYREIGLAFLVPVGITIIFIIVPILLKDVSASAQRVWIGATEHRVSTTASVLHKMKGIKMSSLSDLVGEEIQALRVSEMKISSKFRTVLSASLTIATMSQVVIPFATLVAHVLIMRGKGNIQFDTTTAFTTLTLVALLSNPIKDIARAVPEVAAAAGCLQRIQEYTCSTNLAKDQSTSRDKPATTGDQDSLELGSVQATHESDKDKPLLKVTDASFVLLSEEEPMLRGINLTIAPATWTVLTGPIGCGKSTLLLALMNELTLIKGSMDDHLSMGCGYCSQDPWLSNVSIRQLISSQGDFDEQRYWTVVDACLLRRDMDELPAADQTVIGSNGVSLSGGQKQRLSLARALYARKPLLLLDDVLGGLDATTEHDVVENVFGSNGFLRKNGVAAVLVSHSLALARRADHVIVMGEGGTIIEQGPPTGISLLEEFTDGQERGSISSGNTAKGVERTERTKHSNLDARENGETPKSEVQDVESELARQTGDIKLYAYYLSAIGWPSAIGQIIFVSLFAVSLKLPTLWVRWWAEAEMRDPSAETDKYIGFYGLICGVCLFSFMIFIILMFQHGIPRSSNRLHERLVRSLMNAPYWFLVLTDTGQITNRFSQDMSLLCLQLPFAFADTLLNVGVCLVGTVLITLASKYSATIYPGLLVMLYILQKFYLRTSRQIRLLDLEAKSPIYSHFIQTLQGLTTIRAFKWEESSRTENNMLLNQSQRPFYLMYCIQRWLNLVLDLLVAAVATIVVALATQLDGSSSGALGVSLLNIVTFSQDLTFLIRTWTDLETSLGAIARIKEFERETPSEHLSAEKETLPTAWPSKGKIQISALSSAYKSTSQPILTNISLQIEAGKKVGICGRTGSGKSTFLLTLLRMAEIQGGDILIDDVSIQNIPRNDLRRRLFAMPQDPLFLPGSVRVNIDPFSEHDDDSIISALEEVGMLDVIQERGGLDVNMETMTLSKGQQQLFCLTRAILSKAKVVLLDEITSSVDLATETAMMAAVERNFADRTIIAIAHRLHTIRGFDKIVVLDQGRIVETGSPDELLSHESAFRELWNDSNSGN